MSVSDSGFEDDFHTSPAKPRSVESNVPPPTDKYESEYEEIFFIIQRHNEQLYLARDCLTRQPQVSAEARSKLVSWLLAVHRHLKLSLESCCLAVNILDRFLITTSVAADCFQLLGVTSLLIATKQVEVSAPRIQQLLSLCCNSFSREQLCNLECLVLLRLNFRLVAPTLAFFHDYFTHRLTRSSEAIHTHMDSWKDLLPDRKWKSLSRRVCELTLADYTFNKYRPSLIAWCAIKVAKALLNVSSPLNSDYGPSLRLCNYEIDPVFSHEDHSLMQQCTCELKLLVSLNEEAVQNFLSMEII